MGPGPLELFPFVVLAILMAAMAGGISEHMLTSWSSFISVCVCVFVFIAVKGQFF